jgi:two-component system, chemotaxis family, chemotaxis protein CheY
MGFKVLIVDALQASRESIAGAVRCIQNVEVLATGSSFEALNLLARHRVDLVIASMEMPDLNGLELVNFVKKNPSYRETPLFIIAEEQSETERDRGLAMGAAEYLFRPVKSFELEELLRRYLKVA